MARARKDEAAGRIAGAVLIGLALCLPAAGEETQPTTPLSQECQSGGEAIVAESPLPNVAAALASRKTIKILSIGASPAAGRRTIKGGYTSLIEQIRRRPHLLQPFVGLAGAPVVADAHDQQHDEHRCAGGAQFREQGEIQGVGAFAPDVDAA